MKRWLIGALLLVLGGVVLAACGGSESQSSSSSSSGSSSTSSDSQKASSQGESSGTPSSGSGAQTVTILEGDMSIKSDMTSFKVGTPYHFVVKNEGKVVHEFTIAKKVPGGNQDARDAASVKDVDNIAPGQTSRFDFTFQDPAPAVGMELECSYPGHYEMGMHLDITVT
jgi:uncharacterized cupredoxin-like copper-binding protein